MAGSAQRGQEPGGDIPSRRFFGGGKGGVMARIEAAAPLLDVNEVARRLGTEPRFVRRLIAERRIEFHKLGRHVRISEAALAEFIKAGRVSPATSARRRGASHQSQ